MSPRPFGLRGPGAWFGRLLRTRRGHAVAAPEIDRSPPAKASEDGGDAEIVVPETVAETPIELPPAFDRLGVLRTFVDREMRGIEIGASFNPVAPKADGWNVTTIDHASRDALVEKFTPHGVDVTRIEDVDVVWNGEPLDELLGDAHLGSYDYCIASHVIEHIPDLLGFFASVERILRPGGVLSLAIPDKRHCFDFFRALTSTGDVLYAHHRRLRRHTKKTAFDEIAYAAARDGSGAWDERQRGELSLQHTLEQALHNFAACDESDEAAYVDFHCSFFVPSSFELLIEELRALGMIELEIERTFPGAGCEFYVALRKPNSGAEDGRACADGVRRLALLRRIACELASEAPVD